jgi:predicted Ser/Thr protein kinase
MDSRQISSIQHSVTELDTFPHSLPTSEMKFDINAHWQIDAREVILEELLGQGKQGYVFKATYRKNPVAVKVFHETPENKQASFHIQKTMDLHKKLQQSSYLITYYGRVSSPYHCRVMEYAENGTLRELLEGSRLPESEITVSDLYRWAMQNQLWTLSIT